MLGLALGSINTKGSSYPELTKQGGRVEWNEHKEVVFNKSQKHSINISYYPIMSIRKIWY